jgi:hypothetical protein
MTTLQENEIKINKNFGTKNRLTFRRSGNGFRYMIISCASVRDGCGRGVWEWELGVADDF